ncbi:hypothetical protein Rsub_06672 [Raphidocelis subcapitata]|uniref:WH2 domain-containing protein n=1 Tax=Raphidocelis subcapitata TaxID=307507 RepID=A0A2V0PBL2_9CHLO|nr:hypothetical protein Rsub_06672 [Raphidocelis subcapitata]|eukprot:GBF94557.1 hypothetical protein Rsub_06672 [Raphidocelis subcapitata]
MESVLKELKEKPLELRHTEVEHDGSKPAIEPGAGVSTWDKNALLDGIEKGVPLKHVETVDKSKPVIEADVHIGENPHQKLLAEVQHAAVMREIKHHDPLKHVEKS